MKWIVAAALLFVLAITLNLNLLVYALCVIAGILLISNYVASRWSNQIVARRVTSHKVVEIGDLVTVDIEIDNKDNWPITWMLVEDLIPPESLAFDPPALGVKGKRMDVLKFARHQSHHLHYQMNCNRRGYFQIGPMVAETGDTFGFHRRFKVLAEPHFLLVMPKVIPLSGYDIASRRPIGEVIMTNRLFEDPTRIAGVREYQRGDALNRINWKKTASTGKLQSKIYEPSSLAGATIVIDFHRESFDRKHEPFRSELAVTAAASISSALCEFGQQVGLISNGRDAVDRIRIEGWKGDRRTRDEAKASATMLDVNDRLRPVVVPTRKGPHQNIQILQSLSRLELTDGLKLSQLILETADQLPRDASVIAIVSAITMEAAIALGTLRRQGFSVVAIVNCFSEGQFAQTTAPLIAEGIMCSHLKDESSIRDICEKRVLMK